MTGLERWSGGEADMEDSSSVRIQVVSSLSWRDGVAGVGVGVPGRGAPVLVVGTGIEMGMGMGMGWKRRTVPVLQGVERPEPGGVMVDVGGVIVHSVLL